MWKEIGPYSVVNIIIFQIIFYFVIEWAIKNGTKKGRGDIKEKKLSEDEVMTNGYNKSEDSDL